jgi:hypothetical protein
MNATISDLIKEVRRGLDEVTLSGVQVATDTDLEDTAASNFSDEDIKDRLIDGTRFLVARAEAQHIPNFVDTLSPSDLSVPIGKTAPYVLRLLGSRVNIDGTECTRRTFASHRKLESSGRAADANHPVFVFEDFELLMSAGGSGSTKTAHYVRVPGRNVDQSGASTNPYDDITKLPDKFRSPLIQYVLASCFTTLRRGELSNAAKKRMYADIRPYLLSRTTEKKLQEMWQEQTS